MSKMFVHYSGTVAQFKALDNVASYNDKIVFIKGGNDGKGSAIYTHGEYYTSAHDVEALVASLNIVKGVMVNGDNSTLKVASGHNGVINFTNGDETVAVSADGPGIKISVSAAFRNRVSAVETLANNTSTALGSKSDAASSTGSAFARIASLAESVSALTDGGTGSIADQIDSLRKEIKGTLGSGDSTTLAAINDELDAIDAKWSSYVAKSDLSTEVSDNAGEKVVVTVKTKDGKVSDVSVNETALNTALNSKANANDVYNKTEAETMAQGKVDALANGAVKTNAAAIAVLNGNDTVTGSVAKQIKDAINAFAGSADADNVIENVTELLNYVSGVDGSKTLATAIAQIEENKGKIATLNGNASTAGSVAKAISDEVSRANAAYAVKNTETVASNAAARAEEAYTLASQKATAAEAKA